MPRYRLVHLPSYRVSEIVVPADEAEIIEDKLHVFPLHRHILSVQVDRDVVVDHSRFAYYHLKQENSYLKVVGNLPLPVKARAKNDSLRQLEIQNNEIFSYFVGIEHGQNSLWPVKPYRNNREGKILMIFTVEGNSVPALTITADHIWQHNSMIEVAKQLLQVDGRVDIWWGEVGGFVFPTKRPIKVTFEKLTIDSLSGGVFWVGELGLASMLEYLSEWGYTYRY